MSSRLPVESGGASRIAWLAALILVATLFVAIIAVATRRHARERIAGAVDPSAGAPARSEAEALVSAEQVRRIESALFDVERRLFAIEEALAAHASASPEVTREPAQPKDSRSSEEVHEATIRSLDATLEAERGDTRDGPASADNLRREIAAAMQGKAQVAGVVCTATFCKATIEQDTASGAEPLDMNALMDAVPALKTEAMFDYHTDGTRKRTTIYAARMGQLLPLDRQPVPATSGVAAAAARQP